MFNDIKGNKNKWEKMEDYQVLKSNLENRKLPDLKIKLTPGSGDAWL